MNTDKSAPEQTSNHHLYATQGAQRPGALPVPARAKPLRDAGDKPRGKGVCGWAQNRARRGGGRKHSNTSLFEQQQTPKSPLRHRKALQTFAQAARTTTPPRNGAAFA